MTKYYVIEGVDGVGKSTIIQHLKKMFAESEFKVPVHFIRQPGATELAEKLREMTKTPEIKKDSIVKQMLMTAANFDTYERCVRGKEGIVIGDRSAISGYVYFCAEIETFYRDLERKYFDNQFFFHLCASIKQMLRNLIKYQKLNHVFYIEKSGFDHMFSFPLNLQQFLVNAQKGYKDYYVKFSKHQYQVIQDFSSEAGAKKILEHIMKDNKQG